MRIENDGARGDERVVGRASHRGAGQGRVYKRGWRDGGWGRGVERWPMRYHWDVYQRFGLVLMVTHDCTLRCSYCYGGGKSGRVMPEAVGRKAIERAVASIGPGGTLELSFFGGEPLLEAELVLRLIEYARERTAGVGAKVSLNVTTNATVAEGAAWAALTMPEMELAISCDGEAGVHDRHRRFADGRGSSEAVLGTMRRLMEAGKEFRVVMVVRPDNVEDLPGGIRFLHGLGVRHVEPSLDVWAKWSEEDERRLERVIGECARIWREGLPHRGIGWFDEKVAYLGRLTIAPTARCGFGDGEVAVAPSGRLYPCERLIGEDSAENPMWLGGNAMEGEDFLHMRRAAGRDDEACHQCEMLAMCNTFCRCSNYVRSGNVSHPDSLLCRWNQACLVETAKILEQMSPGRIFKDEGGCL